MMCNLINFPENNPATRNSFSCGQSKQAASIYHTNYQVRMDKSAVVLNDGQIPLVKTRYLEHFNQEENVYGENCVVAIMCYTGYNVEDAVLINEGALQRGLFRTTYYTTYETHEERTKTEDQISERFSQTSKIRPILLESKAIVFMISSTQMVLLNTTDHEYVEEIRQTFCSPVDRAVSSLLVPPLVTL